MMPMLLAYLTYLDLDVHSHRGVITLQNRTCDRGPSGQGMSSAYLQLLLESQPPSRGLCNSTELGEPLDDFPYPFLRASRECTHCTLYRGSVRYLLP